MYTLAFPGQFVNWIMKCIQSVSYSILINGILSKLFKEKKGLRQGDSLSPFLLILAMEYPARNLKKLQDIPNFNYYPRCEKLHIVQLGFADELLHFISVQLLYAFFKQFSLESSVMVNKSKNLVFLGGVDDTIQ